MKLCTDYNNMYSNIIQGGINYLRKYSNIRTMIVGLSGGIDSTLTAILAREICDRTAIHKVIGVSIPIVSNKEPETQRAKDVGERICHEFREVKSINTIFKLARRLLKAKTTAEKIRLGNVKARLRMITLYDTAHRRNGIVLSTDNLSEFNLGFWTLHGDVGDFGLIQSLWKTETYGLADFLCRKYDRLFASDLTCWMEYGFRLKALLEAAKAIPTDGLGITTSDYDQLGVDSYQEADKILIEYLNTGNKELEDHPVIKRHIKYAFKRENPYNIPRESIVGEQFNITKGMPFTMKSF